MTMVKTHTETRRNDLSAVWLSGSCGELGALSWSRVVVVVCEQTTSFSRENKRMSLSVCTDISSSAWLVGQDIPWYQFSVKGPVGFRPM